MYQSSMAADGRRRVALIRDAGLVLAGSALVAAAAKVQIPLSPVPMTCQDFAVLLIGATLGPWRGAAALIAYLLEGVLGLPVFAGPVGGVAYLLGPTAGYLFAFPIAAWVIGWFVQAGWGRRLGSCLVAVLAADALIFALGVGWASAMLGWRGAVTAGLLPFVPWSLIKIGVVAALVCAAQRRRLSADGTPI